MLFSEFADIIYKRCGGTAEPHEFFLLLFENLMQNSETEEGMQNEEDSHNPFEKLQPDTLTRLFKGKNPISPKKARAVRALASTDKFATYIEGQSWDAQSAIDADFKQRIKNFNAEDNLGYACADLFLQIIDDIVDGNESSSPALDNTSSQPLSDKPVTIPSSSVYYDESDGKIHIGNIGISIPKELEPPKDIAPEEEIYVRELLTAYADAEKAGTLTQADLDALPLRYKRNFSDQRINYYSAVRIDRFVRESIADGDDEVKKWKSGTLDYIKDTLWDDYDNGYKRLIAVMKKVVDSSTTSVITSFDSLVSAKEKKGVCHMLVNDGRIKWVDEDD